eukprot:11838942-Prorocentrum_lima.AAC.1
MERAAAARFIMPAPVYETIVGYVFVLDCAFLDVIITLLWAAKGALCLQRPLEPALLEQRMG